MSISRNLICIICMACLGACSQNYSEEEVGEALRQKELHPMGSGKKKAAEETIAGGEKGGASLGGIRAVIPQGWKSKAPSNSMRIAEFLLEGEAGDATLAVFQLGGSVEANIKRWYSQFSQPDGGSTEERVRRWQKEVDGMTATLVDMGGTYAGMGAMGRSSDPVANYRMLAAIVEAPRGLFFFKLVGPDATLEHWAESFEKYVDSIEKE